MNCDKIVLCSGSPAHIYQKAQVGKQKRKVPKMATNQAVSPLNIQIENVPDRTYFRTSDVVPHVEGETLVITDGTGKRRSWGSPSCDTVVYQIGEIIAAHVTGWHKHTVGPVGGWYYFLQTAKGWQRVTANKKEIKALGVDLPALGRFQPLPSNVIRLH